MRLLKSQFICLIKLSQSFDPQLVQFKIENTLIIIDENVIQKKHNMT